MSKSVIGAGKQEFSGESFVKTLSISILVLLAISSLAFVTSASATFSTPTNLGAGFDPNVQSVGSHVYVAWTDKSGGILFRVSSDLGQSWGSILTVGKGGDYPIMSASGSDVYMVWSSGGLLFSSSSDYGATWTKQVKVSTSGGTTPFIASDGAVVAVVYRGTGGSYVTSSSNSGTTWTKPFLYSNGPEPQVAVSGSNIYASADSINRAHIEFAVSHNSGASWKINNMEGGSESWIVASGSDVYAAWETKSTQSVVWFLSSTDNGNTLNTKIISTGIPDAWNPMIFAIGNKVWVGIQEFGSSQIWMLTSTNSGASWTKESVSGLGHKEGFVFNIATTDGTNVFAMWLQETGTVWSALVASSSNGGSTWSVTNIGQTDPNADVAIGSISSSGSHALAAWQESSAIWFSHT